MDEERKIIVTNELMKCLEVLEMVKDSLPKGDVNESYEKAVWYISAVLKGEELPKISCPGGAPLVGD